MTVIALLVLIVAGCPGLSETVFETNRVCVGVEYIHKWAKDVPSSVHVLRAERGRPELQLVTMLPSGNSFGLSPMTEMVKFIPAEVGRALGGVNGDFFSWRKGPYQGDPGGLQIIHGELTSDPHAARPHDILTMGGISAWFDPDGTPHIGRVTPYFEVIWPNGTKTPFGLNEECTENDAILFTHVCGCSTRTTNGIEFILERGNSGPWLPLRAGRTYSARIREIGSTNSTLTTNTLVLSIGSKLAQELPSMTTGMTLTLSTRTTPDLSRVPNAMSGGPWLVRNRKPIQVKNETEKHPRAAFGFNATHYFFVVADGRRAGISDGMTFTEMAAEMAWWGCEEAMNVDGGGSAMLLVDGVVRSQPSDNRERPCANALVLVRRPGQAAAAAPGQ